MLILAMHLFMLNAERRRALLLTAFLLCITGTDAKKTRSKKRKAEDVEMESILDKILAPGGRRVVSDATAFSAGNDDLWQPPPVLLEKAQVAISKGLIARAHRLCFAAYMHAVTRGDESGFAPADVRVKYALPPDDLKSASQLHLNLGRLLTWYSKRTKGRTTSSKPIETSVNAALGLDTDPENPNATRDRYKPDGTLLTHAEYSANMRANVAAGTYDRAMGKIRGATQRRWAEAGGLDASADDQAANSLDAIDETAKNLMDDARYSRPFLSTSEAEATEWADSLEAGTRVRIHNLDGEMDAELRDETLVPQAAMLNGRPGTLVRYDPGTGRWLLSIDAHAGFRGPEPLPGQGAAGEQAGAPGDSAEAAVTVSVRTVNLAPLIWRSGSQGGSAYKRQATPHRQHEEL